MLYPVEEFIKNQDLLCVSSQETVRDALTKMLEHDYSQLPITDADGNLTGIITEQSVARSYYHLDEKVSVLDLKVNNCRENPVTVPIDQDVFDALDLLNKVYAVVVVHGRKPVGIITNFDTTNFFRDVSEGMILVEDIEVMLRQQIDGALPREQDRELARVNAFKHLMKSDDSQAPTYDHMTFNDYVMLITNNKNWPKFEKSMESRDLFRVYMEQVREIRNQLAHFRGRLDPIQYDVLLRARDWLGSRTVEKAPTKSAAITELPIDKVVKQTGGKYGRLENWLKAEANQARPGVEIQLTFSQLEELIDDKLPPSAQEHRAWWANDNTSGRQSMAWLGAGWRVENVDFAAETVTFHRTDSVFYQVFYADLLARLKEQRPGLTRAVKTWPHNWWNFSGGRSGFWFGWVFDQDHQLRTELYIDTEDKKKNKQLFDTLYEQKDEIEEALGYPLTWERLDHRRASRIFTALPATIRDDPEKREKTKVWALEKVQELVDVFQIRIKKMP